MCLFGISTVLSSVISDKNLTGEERDIIYFRQSAKRLKVLKKFKTAPAIFPTEAKKNEKTFCSGLDSNRPTCLRHGTVAKVLFEQSINSGIIYGNVAIKWNSMATVNGSSCKQYLQVSLQMLLQYHFFPTVCHIHVCNFLFFVQLVNLYLELINKGENTSRLVMQNFL